MNQTLLPENVTIRAAELEVASIIMLERQRKVDPEHVAFIRASVAELGYQLVPIVVSERSNGTLVLIDGAHRLVEAGDSGRSTIRAEVYRGLTLEQEQLLQHVANSTRKNLSAAELLWAYETFEAPLYEFRARQNQLAGLKRGTEDPVPGNTGNGETAPAPMSMSMSMSKDEYAKERTGKGLDYLRKTAAVRDIAEDETQPPEVREVAQRGFDKLQKVGTSPDPIFKAVMKHKEAVELRQLDPEVAKLQAAEKRLDEVVIETTLLQEKLDGDLGEVLTMAANKNAMGREQLRGVRVALTHALSAVVILECEIEGDPAANLRQIGTEVTKLLSELSVKKLGLEATHA
ncbi:hypothetical protein [Leucobacter musarum]|uniref:hypothetical protein n=1 Tax=Leucobacter musarum TaxID=1930747 RepID=UPI0006A772C0|nr:hypothetical protein [Leucobacter musarum]